MAAHRYWRVCITANNGDSYYSIQEIELRGSVGGADLTTPAMTAATNNAFLPAANAFDNDFADYFSPWLSNPGASTPLWVSIDLGSAQSVAELAMWCQNYAGGPARAPQDFKLQSSDDNSSWTDEASFTGVTTWAAGTAKTFAIGGGGPVDTPINPGVGTLTLAGYAPTVAQTANQALAPGVGTLALTGYAPSVVRTANVALTPGVGALTLAGYAPTVTRSTGANLTPGAGTLALTGYAPTVAQSGNQLIAPAVGTLTITGYAPTVSQPQSVTPGAGTLAIAGYAPTVVQSVNQSVSPGAGTLAITGYAPAVAQSSNQQVTPGAGALSIVGYAPTVGQTITVAITPDVGQLTVTGYAPTVAQDPASPVITPGAGTLTVTGYAPDIRQGSIGAGDYPQGKSKRLTQKQIVRELTRLNELVRLEELPQFEEVALAKTPAPEKRRPVEDDEDEEALALLFA
ncbi:MAG: Bordetella phage [Pseudomonadota bacterium]|jgi:hypothetical protein